MILRKLVWREALALVRSHYGRDSPKGPQLLLASASGCPALHPSEAARIGHGSAPRRARPRPLPGLSHCGVPSTLWRIRGGAWRAQALYAAEVATGKEGKDPLRFAKGTVLLLFLCLLFFLRGRRRAPARAAEPRLRPFPPPAWARPRGCLPVSPRWRSTRQVRGREAGVAAQVSNRRPAGCGPAWGRCRTLRLHYFRRRLLPPSWLL